MSIAVKTDDLNIEPDQPRACSNNKRQIKYPEYDNELPGLDCRSAVG